MPPGPNPLQFLLQILKAKYSYYENISIVDNVIYNRYIHFLAASFWSGPMGRAQALNTLTLSHVETLLDPTSYVEATEFKTQNVYGIQAIRLTDFGRKALNLYLEKFRPYAQGELVPTFPTDPLVIKLDRTAVKSLGEKVY
jgi:hypothetical protein